MNMLTGKEKVVFPKTERNVMSLSKMYVNGTKEEIIKRMQPTEIESRRLRIFSFAGPADRLDGCSGDFGARLHRLEDGDQIGRAHV